MPIPVASFFLPRGTNTYFLLEDKYVRGGLQIAENAAARDSIIEMNRKPFMIVITEDDGLMWQLDRDLVTWNEFKMGGGDGDGGPRQTIVHTVPEIAPYSYAEFELPLGNTAIVYRLSVSAACTVEAHSTPEMADSNPFRFIATAEYLQDDGSTELADGTIVRNRRYHLLANLEEEPSGNIYFRILNTSEEAISVELTCMFKPIEL